jgi:hypothetical protein
MTSCQVETRGTLRAPCAHPDSGSSSRQTRDCLSFTFCAAGQLALGRPRGLSPQSVWLATVSPLVQLLTLLLSGPLPVRGHDPRADHVACDLGCIRDLLVRVEVHDFRGAVSRFSDDLLRMASATDRKNALFQVPERRHAFGGRASAVGHRCGSLTFRVVGRARGQGDERDQENRAP